MTQAMRRPDGGRIDRSRVIRFTFDGRALTGHPGDTVASALVANGIHLMGRSFKYHRPRGLLGAGVEEPNALMDIARGPGRHDPNQRATTVPLVDGLVVESQNRAPSLSRDAGALNGLLSPFIPAGFYYKTFLCRARSGTRCTSHGFAGWPASAAPRTRQILTATHIAGRIARR